MTRDEILAMKPGRELDALVMRTVFKAEKKDIGDECYWVLEVNGEEVCWPRWFSPSTDIAAAWEVAEQLQKQGYVVCIELLPYEETSVGVYEADPANQIAYAKAQTPAEAICKAALLAVMEE